MKIVDRRRQRPSPTATMDWAYVYDRNGDDSVDYLVYLDGPNAIIPVPAPQGASPHPRGGHDDGADAVPDAAHAHAVLALADDNYDGVADAYVVGTVDDRSGWIDGHVVVRSTGFDGRYDECRYVPGARGTAPATCRGTEHGYGVPGHSLTGLLVVPPGRDYELFQRINAAARECGPYQPPLPSQVGTRHVRGAPCSIRRGGVSTIPRCPAPTTSAAATATPWASSLRASP